VGDQPVALCPLAGCRDHRRRDAAAAQVALQVLAVDLVQLAGDGAGWEGGVRTGGYDQLDVLKPRIADEGAQGGVNGRSGLGGELVEPVDRQPHRPVIGELAERTEHVAVQRP
jgi:hypothetical protein